MVEEEGNGGVVGGGGGLEGKKGRENHYGWDLIFLWGRRRAVGDRGQI